MVNNLILRIQFLVILLIKIHLTTCLQIYPYFGILTPIYTKARNVSTNRYANEAEYKHLLEEHGRLGKLQREFLYSTPFFCDVKGPGRRSETPPTSVHELRPGDIDVVGTVGDSGSSGTGVLFKNISGLIIENRGITYSSGGDGTWRQFLTLPNILKEYNPNLYGYSHGSAPSHWKSAGFNVAEALALSEHVMYQIEFIYDRMRSDPKVDMERHWKLITIAIGNNDLCGQTCYNVNYIKAIEKHKKNVVKVLRFIRDKMPRTFVNYLLIANVQELFSLEVPNSCNVVNALECPCKFHVKLRKKLVKVYSDFMEKWIKADSEVISRAEFHNKEDFEVVIQPFMRGIQIPKLPNGTNDMRYMAFDCFHFSQLGHATAANILWNNMLQPIGEKQIIWTRDFSYFECPTEKRPFFATIKNSRK